MAKTTNRQSLSAKVALTIIVAGIPEEAPYLERCLESVKDYVDGIWIQVNSPKGKRPSRKVWSVAKKYGNVYHRVWDRDFVAARQHCLEKIPPEYDWILWLDSDDIVVNPEGIRLATKLNAHGLYVPYDYTHDEYGNVSSMHRNNRMVRNGYFKWRSNANVHTLLVETKPAINEVCELFRVRHDTNPERQMRSLERNIPIFEAVKDPDAMTLMYLASNYYGVGRFQEAIETALRCIDHPDCRSGVKSEAYGWLGRALIKTDLAKARMAFISGLAENPDNNRIILELGNLEYLDGRYEIALSWLMKEPVFELAIAFVDAPLEVTFSRYLLIAQCLIKLNRRPQARKWVNKALQLRPGDETALRVKSLLRPYKWPRKSIVIYAVGQFGPDSLKDGIGGSEEAIIRLKPKLEKLGWRVVVYCSPPETSETWRDIRDFNPQDRFDVVVAWRNLKFFESPIKARKKYLWLHDIPDQPIKTDNLDKVIVLSQFHADSLDTDKIFISGNGVPLTRNVGFPRDPHRLIYTSSPNRGLGILYEIWPEVKRAVPDATLSVYYGWEIFDRVHSDPLAQEWKRRMIRRGQELDGVTDYGKVSQDEITIQLYQSGIFAYPCTYPEVYCISLFKAIVCGCIPVTSNYGCLAEYPIDGVPFDSFGPDEIEAYKNRLIAVLKGKYPTPNAYAWAISHNWDNTAAKWDLEFK